MTETPMIRTPSKPVALTTKAWSSCTTCWPVLRAAVQSYVTSLALYSVSKSLARARVARRFGSKAAAFPDPSISLRLDRDPQSVIAFLCPLASRSKACLVVIGSLHGESHAAAEEQCQWPACVRLWLFAAHVSRSAP